MFSTSACFLSFYSLDHQLTETDAVLNFITGEHSHFADSLDRFLSLPFFDSKSPSPLRNPLFPEDWIELFSSRISEKAPSTFSLRRIQVLTDSLLSDGTIFFFSRWLPPSLFISLLFPREHQGRLLSRPHLIFLHRHFCSWSFILSLSIAVGMSDRLILLIGVIVERIAARLFLHFLDDNQVSSVWILTFFPVIHFGPSTQKRTRIWIYL